MTATKFFFNFLFNNKRADTQTPLRLTGKRGLMGMIGAFTLAWGTYP